MTLVYLSLAWLAGIALAARAPHLSIVFWLVPAALAALGLSIGRKSRPARLFFGCGLLLALGATRYALAIPHFGAHDLATYNDRGTAVLEGVLVDAPDVRDTHVNLRLRAERLTLADGQPHEVSGLALVQAPRFGDYRYGDSVRVEGTLETPPVFEDFSYRDYLARQGVYSTVSRAEVESLGQRRGSPLRRAMLDFRARADGVITRLLPDPQASLLKGILLGVESGIAPDVRDDFNAAGATHVIAISGSNLAILAGLLRGVTRRWLPSNWSALATVAGIFVYTLFVGGDPAVTRAFVMAAVGISGLEVGRQTFGPTTLSFTAVALTALNPLLLWDAGFLLSFLSTWGIVLYAEPLSDGLERLLTRRLPAETAARVVSVTAEAVVVTVAAQITTTPIIALFFGRLSLVSLPVNLLIVPAQGPLMILGGIAVLVAMLIWPLGQLLAWVDWLFLSFTLLVVRAFAELPFASLAVNVTPGAVGAFYALLFGATFVAAQSPTEHARWKERLGRAWGVKAMVGVGLAAAVLLGVVAGSLPDGRLHVRFLDVPGGATLIRTPQGDTVLVDGGSSGRALSTALGDGLPFWSRRLDLMVVTQPTPDHVGGLPPVMERYRVGSLLTDGQPGDSEESDALWAAVDAEGVPEQVAYPGMQIETGDGVTLTVLHAQPVVLRVAYGEAEALLVGDLTPEVEAALLSGEFGQGASVLCLPAYDEALRAAADPQLVVVAGGPAPGGAEGDGPPIYHTPSDGTVHVATDGQRLWVRPRP